MKWHRVAQSGLEISGWGWIFSGARYRNVEIRTNKLFHLLHGLAANSWRPVTLGNLGVSVYCSCLVLFQLGVSEVSLASCSILISCTKLNTALKAALLTFTEGTKRFFNRIDLSVAKKIALEDTWLHRRIRALDLWRVSVHCPPAFPYKPKWLTNVIYNSPIKIRNKTLSLRWWDKEDSTAECGTEGQFTRLVLKSER